MIDKLISVTTEENTILKLCEELAELQEVLLKYLNKSPKEKPLLSKIVKEISDVEFNLIVLKSRLGLHSFVANNIAEKEKQVTKWYEEKYS